MLCIDGVRTALNVVQYLGYRPGKFRTTSWALLASWPRFKTGYPFVFILRFGKNTGDLDMPGTYTCIFLVPVPEPIFGYMAGNVRFSIIKTDTGPVSILAFLTGTEYVKFLRACVMPMDDM